MRYTVQRWNMLLIKKKPAQQKSVVAKTDTRAKLKVLLATDLGFHGENNSESSHDFHAFPAKFPPQLPRLFISNLTNVGEKVLDPMMGSGTCVVESIALGREGIGFDIDPLAVLLSKVKTKALNPETVQLHATQIVEQAEHALNNGSRNSIKKNLNSRFSEKTREFIDYWFSPQSQMELTALIREIENIREPEIREFFLLAFSAIIITKSGGVSLAWDLAHTRPHKLNQGIPKSYRSAILDFRKRLAKNIASLRDMARGTESSVNFGNAEALPLPNNSIDLLFTSPPYASNAIDYMRAHKFSLVWMGKPVDELSVLRSKYIGGENVTNFAFENLPAETRKTIEIIHAVDSKKSLVLHRYYSEMQRVLLEAFRVLKPGKAALFVVGTSNMRGIDSQTQNCIGEIGSAVGFELVGIGTRQLDRDRRMLPARLKKSDSQIEERMHEEYVVALVKPEGKHKP
jgi:DNA modification methylase